MEYSVRLMEYKPNEGERQREREKIWEIKGERRTIVAGKCTRELKINKARAGRIHFTSRDMHLGFWEKIRETKGFCLHWLIYRPSVRKRGESTESTATVTGTHAVREGRANTHFVLLCIRANMNMCTGKTRRCSLTFTHTYVCTWVREPHVGRRRHCRFSRWILERAEVRLQRTVHKTASLQNREIGRHGYLRVAFLRRRGGPLKDRVLLLQGPSLAAEG